MDGRRGRRLLVAGPADGGLDRVRSEPAGRARAVAILGGTLVRLVGAVGGGWAVYALSPDVRARPVPFLLWGLAFYLITLAVETSLVLVRHGAPDAPGGFDARGSS